MHLKNTQNTGNSVTHSEDYRKKASLHSNLFCSLEVLETHMQLSSNKQKRLNKHLYDEKKILLPNFPSNASCVPPTFSHPSMPLTFWKIPFSIRFHSIQHIHLNHRHCSLVFLMGPRNTLDHSSQSSNRAYPVSLTEMSSIQPREGRETVNLLCLSFLIDKVLAVTMMVTPISQGWYENLKDKILNTMSSIKQIYSILYYVYSTITISELSYTRHYIRSSSGASDC